MEESQGQIQAVPVVNKAHRGLYWYTAEAVDAYLEHLMLRQEQLRQQKQPLTGICKWKIHPRKMRDGGEFLNDLVNQIRVLVQDEPESHLVVRFSDSKKHYFGPIAACMDQLIHLSSHCPTNTNRRILVIFPHHNEAWPNHDTANAYYENDAHYHKIMEPYGIAVTMGGLANFTNFTLKDTIRWERKLHNYLLRDINQRIWPGFVSKRDNEGATGSTKPYLANVNLGQGEINGAQGKRRIDSAEDQAHGEAKKPAPEYDARKPGKCSKCGQRGHYFRNCPARKPKASEAEGDGEAQPKGSEADGPKPESRETEKSGGAVEATSGDNLEEPEQMEEGEEPPLTKLAVTNSPCQECGGVHVHGKCVWSSPTETLPPTTLNECGELHVESYMDPPVRGVITLEVATDSEGDESLNPVVASGIGEVEPGKPRLEPPPVSVEYVNDSTIMTDR